MMNKVIICMNNGKTHTCKVKECSHLYTNLCAAIEKGYASHRIKSDGRELFLRLEDISSVYLSDNPELVDSE